MIATILSVVVIAINTYFVIATVNEFDLGTFSLFVIVLFGILYLLFCAYLVIHMAISMGNRSMMKYEFVKKYIYTNIDCELSPTTVLNYSRYL